MIVSVDNFADANLPANHLRQHQSIERHQKLIIRGELVPEDEPRRNQLRRFTPPFRWHSLQCMNTSFQVLRSHRDIECKSPLRRLQLVAR